MTTDHSAELEATAGAHKGATRTPRSRRRPWVLIILELLIAASALYGGVALIWNNALGMPDDWLQATPFSTWVLPGVLLLLIVAGPMITAGVLELRRSSWSTVGSVLAGSADVGWIAAQLLIIQKYNVLQPVMIFAGLAVILLALWAARARPPVPGRFTERLTSESSEVSAVPRRDRS